MTDQETGGAPAPDANASQAPEPTDVERKEPGSEADSSPAATESEKPAKPAKSGEQIRIDELTRRLRETERRYERVLRIAEDRSPREPEPAQPAPAAAKPKTLEDFNYDQAAFVKHVATETASSAAAAARAELAKERQQEQAAARREVFDARAEAFAKTVEDYEEVLSGKWACSEPMAEVIEESDEGPALAYYLAQNPDEASKLAKLSPAQTGRELAKLEDRLVSERKKATQKSVSQAPPPAPKIEAKEASLKVSSTSDPESDKLTDEEWFKLAEKERVKKRKGA